MLSWEAPADGQSGFDIEYSLDGVNFTQFSNSYGGGTRVHWHS